MLSGPNGYTRSHVICTGTETACAALRTAISDMRGDGGMSGFSADVISDAMAVAAMTGAAQTAALLDTVIAAGGFSPKRVKTAIRKARERLLAAGDRESLREAALEDCRAIVRQLEEIGAGLAELRHGEEKTG